jgi:hypothetical protein
MLAALNSLLWKARTDGPSGGDAMKDINDVAIAVGSTVKLVGTVVSINANDPHFQDLIIALIHPNGYGPASGVIVRAHPLNVVVGS